MLGQDLPVRKNTTQKLKMAKHSLIPNGYFNDPPGTKCPYCGETNKICSYTNGVNRAWGRMICEKKMKQKKTDI